MSKSASFFDFYFSFISKTENDGMRGVKNLTLLPLAVLRWMWMNTEKYYYYRILNIGVPVIYANHKSDRIHISKKKKKMFINKLNGKPILSIFEQT